VPAKSADDQRDQSPTTHELDAPPWLRVETTLMNTARAMREAYDARFAALGLNLTQASLIAYLREFGPVTQTKCADHLRLGRANIGAIIDRLQERRLVERHPDVIDRRVWRVALSPAGVDVAEQVLAIDEVLRSEMRAGISRAERQALASVMTRLQQNLLRATSHSSQPQATLENTP
jgi:DNA-binding MarR family transcriptional regulator